MSTGKELVACASAETICHDDHVHMVFMTSNFYNIILLSGAQQSRICLTVHWSSWLKINSSCGLPSKRNVEYDTSLAYEQKSPDDTSHYCGRYLSLLRTIPLIIADDTSHYCGRYLSLLRTIPLIIADDTSHYCGRYLSLLRTIPLIIADDTSHYCGRYLSLLRTIPLIIADDTSHYCGRYLSLLRTIPLIIAVTTITLTDTHK